MGNARLVTGLSTIVAAWGWSACATADPRVTVAEKRPLSCRSKRLSCTGSKNCKNPSIASLPPPHHRKRSTPTNQARTRDRLYPQAGSLASVLIKQKESKDKQSLNQVPFVFLAPPRAEDRAWFCFHVNSTATTQQQHQRNIMTGQHPRQQAMAAAAAPRIMKRCTATLLLLLLVGMQGARARLALPFSPQRTHRVMVSASRRYERKTALLLTWRVVIFELSSC